MSTKFDRILKEVPPEIKLMVSKSFDITERILDILDARGMTQKEFAHLLGKKESEICKWMKGTHNFTLETIAKIEIALGEALLEVPRNRQLPVLESAKQQVFFDLLITVKEGRLTAQEEIEGNTTVYIKTYQYQQHVKIPLVV
ncbi:multiprotein-bridging factor 1 family protein [Chitinophaga eiseniae]|uniref:Helix-turn-helix transcriptional regulator n=1 Tax=Chitinophaga eiseniae TaxID=634771 RepID=A0A847ST07_9BACT|nr:helix-turn-helix transcriptional regulator [Chitinophaga eiseniae]NLR80599.1 helix-turn-helix transcriptional regulator [Chitinophaga eiseniae]